MIRASGAGGREAGVAESGRTMIEQRKEEALQKWMLSPSEVAVVLDLSRGTVLRLIKAGEIPAQRYGRQWRVPRHLLMPRRRVETNP